MMHCWSLEKRWVVHFQLARKKLIEHLQNSKTGKIIERKEFRTDDDESEE